MAVQHQELKRLRNVKVNLTLFYVVSPFSLWMHRILCPHLLIQYYVNLQKNNFMKAQSSKLCIYMALIPLQASY